MWFPTAVLAIVVLVLVLVGALREKPRGLPPGPRGLPIFGSIFCLMKDTFAKMGQFAKRYGPVYTLKLGPESVVMLSDIASIQEAFSKRSDDFDGRPHVMTKATGMGRRGLVLLSPGSYHKYQRKNTLSILRDLGVGTPRFDEMVKPHLQSLLTQFGNTPKVVNMKNISSNMMGDIIGGLTFGQSIYQDNTTTSVTVRKLISENFKTNPVLILIGTFLPAMVKRALSNFVDMESNIAKMMHLMKSLTTSHYNVKDTEDDMGEECFVAKYIKGFARSNDGKMPTDDHEEEEQLGALIIDFFQAGCETTDIYLRWVLLLLAANPEVQRKVQEELDSVFGNDQPRLELKSKLPYTTAVLYEALRMRPPAPMGAPHCTTTEVKFQGYTIPAETMLLIDLMTANFLEKDFPEPHQFRPERFLDDNGQLTSLRTVLAFGTGHRMCIGEQLAKSITMVSVMSILHNYNLRSKDGGEVDLSYFGGVNLFPIEHHIMVYPRQRDNKV